MIAGASFINKKKTKEQGFLRKSHQKTYTLDPGSVIWYLEKFIPDSGSRNKGVKKQYPRSGSTTLCGGLG
jgi:hypothetical protein